MWTDLFNNRIYIYHNNMPPNNLLSHPNIRTGLHKAQLKEVKPTGIHRILPRF